MTTKAMATQYIRDQIEIMKKHGDTPHLSAESRREAIAGAQKTFDMQRHTAQAMTGKLDKRTE